MQIAGYVGRGMQSPKIARITGLDTPDVKVDCGGHRCLGPKAATYVEEIHTRDSVTRKGNTDFYLQSKGAFRQFLLITSENINRYLSCTITPILTVLYLM